MCLTSLLMLAGAAMAQPQSSSPSSYGDRQAGHFGDPGAGYFGNPGDGNFGTHRLDATRNQTSPQAAGSAGRNGVPAPYVEIDPTARAKRKPATRPDPDRSVGPAAPPQPGR